MPVDSKRFCTEGVSRIICANSAKSRAASATTGAERARIFLGEVALHAAGNGEPSPAARSEKAGGGLQQQLLETRRVGGGHDERHVAAQGADIGNVGQHALKFQADQPQCSPARRHGYAEGVLNRLAVGNRMGKAVVARYRLGQHRPAHDRRAFEEGLRSFVGIEMPQFQVKHSVANDTETKMPGLDDARVHRSDRHLANALALHLQEAVFALRHGISRWLGCG